MPKVKKIIISIIVVLIVGIIIFSTCTQSGKNILDISLALSNGKKIDIQGNYDEFKDFEKQLECYEVYLTGESHGVELSYKMEEYMAKYFIENHNVKYIILENSVSEAELLNRYLETGNEEILKSIMKIGYNTIGYNKDTYDLDKFYYEYYKELSENEKFMFIGIDIEKKPLITGLYMSYLIEELGEPPHEISEIIKKAKNRRNFEDEIFVKNFKQSIKENEKLYLDYFKDNFFYVNMVLRNLNSAEMGVEREEYMIRNFQDYFNKLPYGKYFGQLGTLHTAKRINTIEMNGESNYDTFANYINNFFEPVKGKVCSIIYWYLNSYENDGRGNKNKIELDIPYIKSMESIRLYTGDNKKVLSKVLSKINNRLAKEQNIEYEENFDMWGEMFFLLKDSKASPQFEFK